MINKILDVPIAIIYAISDTSFFYNLKVFTIVQFCDSGII